MQKVFRNFMLFEIRGMIYWEPHPIDLSLKGNYDRECERIEFSGS
jgi:type VI secretion system protein ImpF